MRGSEHGLTEEVLARAGWYGFAAPAMLSTEPMSIDAALAKLGTAGLYGALDEPEGAVWRVERNGKVDFLCKYVRPDKVDGKYLDSVTGLPPVWNWRP